MRNIKLTKTYYPFFFLKHSQATSMMWKKHFSYSVLNWYVMKASYYHLGNLKMVRMFQGHFRRMVQIKKKLHNYISAGKNLVFYDKGIKQF